MKKLFLILVFIGFFGIINAQIKPNENTVKTTNWEVWQDKIPVSGGIRVGLMLQSSNQKIKPSSFYVDIPKTNLNTLCVELSSKDGRYSAKLDYDISNVNIGFNELLLPTKYKKQLSKYSTDEVVILVSLGKSCDDNPVSYLISSWKKMLKDSIGVVYVNSQIPTTIELGTQEYECKDLKSPTIAYNKKCSIPLNNIPKNTMLYLKQRVRRFGSVKFNSYEVPIKHISFEN